MQKTPLTANISLVNPDDKHTLKTIKVKIEYGEHSEEKTLSESNLNSSVQIPELAE